MRGNAGRGAERRCTTASMACSRTRVDSRISHEAEAAPDVARPSELGDLSPEPDVVFNDLFCYL
jgi:hypothetical protein